MLVHFPLLGEVEEACKPFLEVKKASPWVNESINPRIWNHGKNLKFHLNNLQNITNIPCLEIIKSRS
jgi:hypothetical protein